MYNRFLIMMNSGVFDAVYSESQPSRKAKTFSRLTTRTGVNMGTRGEIFTKPVKVKNRTYFFNVKENTKGDVFLQVVESKDSEGAGFERHSVVIFEDELQPFLAGLDECLSFIEDNRKTRSKARFEKFQEEKKRESRKPDNFQKRDSFQKRDERANGENKAALFKKKPRKVVRSVSKK